MRKELTQTRQKKKKLMEKRALIDEQLELLSLREEELENERPFQPEDQNLLSTILDNLDKNFPTPRVEFYYPFENVECSTF